MPGSRWDRIAQRLDYQPKEKEVSPLNQISDAYQWYDSNVQEPVSEFAKQATDKIIDVTTPVPEAKQTLKETTGPALSTGLEMALDPTNLIPAAKVPVGIGAGIIARKEADAINKAVRAAMKEGKSFIDALYENLKLRGSLLSGSTLDPQAVTNVPYTGQESMDQRRSQILSDTVADLHGSAILEKLGVPENTDLVKHIKAMQPQILEVPENKMRILDK
jgi:hypothetical protein